MKKHYKLTIIIIACLSLSWTLRGNFRATAIVIPVSQGTAINAIAGNVKVIASAEFSIKSHEEGRIVDMIYPQNNGFHSINEGDCLCKIDTTFLDLELNQIQHDIDATKRQISTGHVLVFDLEDSLLDLKHDSFLFIMDELSSIFFNRKKSQASQLVQKFKENYDNLSSRYINQRKIFDQLQRRRDNCTIYSPINGLITEVYTMIGEYAQSGSVVSKIISKDHLISISISEEDFPGITIGKSVTISLLGYPSKNYYGTVSQLFATADPASKRRSIFVKMDNEPLMMAPGMTGEATIVKSERERSLLIPRRSLNGNTVFIVKNGYIEKKIIQIGFSDLMKVEVISGLKLDDLVIVEDIQNFREGDSVNIKELPVI